MRDDIPEGSGSDRRVRWLLALVLAVAFLLRLTYLLEASRAPDFAVPQFEAQYHDYWARALVTGDWTPPAGVTDPEIRSRPFFRPPGYPYFLAGVYALLGPGYLWPRLVQLLLGVGACALVFAVGRRLAGDGVGLGGAALYAVAWVPIFFEAELLAPSLLVFLLLLALVAALRWRAVPGFGWAVAAGGLLGMAALVRPNVLLLPPIFLLWGAWLFRRRGGWTGWRPLLHGVAFAAAVVVAVAPATWRNRAVAGEWVLVTSNAGVNLFVGIHPESDGTTPGVPELGEMTGLAGWDSFDYPKVAAAVEREVGREMTDSEVSRYFTRRALDHAFEHPGQVLALTARKAALFFGPAEVSNNKVLSMERRRSPTLRLGLGFATLLALAVAGLGAGAFDLRRGAEPAGDGAARRRAVEVAALLLLFAAIYAASFLPFFVAARFRVPIVPVLAVFGGWGLAAVWRAARERRFRHVGAALLLLVLLRAATGVAWVPYRDDPALWHFRRGLLHQQQGDVARAVEELRRAVALDPGDDQAHLALAVSLAAAGRPEEAAAEYRAHLAVDPTSVTAHNNLAMLLAGRGELDAAVDHWRAALALDPERVGVLANLALALATHPDPERRDLALAVELADRARRLAGDRDPRLEAILERVYGAAGSGSEAGGSTRIIDPSSSPGRHGTRDGSPRR